MTKENVTKPILVVRFPLGSIDSRKIEEIAFEDLQNKIDDYHIIGLRDNSVDRIEFECYNSPHTDIEFEDLRERLLEAVRIARDMETAEKNLREKALSEMVRLDQEMGLYDDFENKNRSKIKVYSAFPGTGKSTYSRLSTLNVVDLGISDFDNENFPENYVQYIKEKIEDPHVNFILVSSHKKVIELLDYYEIPFVLVYPKRSAKEEYLNRFKIGGNPESFIKLAEKNWDKWIDEMSAHKNCEKSVLETKEYLSNIMPDTQSS